MNAHTRSLTAAGIVRVLTVPAAKPSKAVHRVSSIYGGTDCYGMPAQPRHVVLVAGEYFEVNDRMLAMIEAGHSPDALGLEPVEPEEI